MRAYYILTREYAGQITYCKSEIINDQWSHDINQAKRFTEQDICINLVRIRAGNYKIERCD